jgi:hypothetical protein
LILRADVAEKIPDGTLDIFFLDVAHQALGNRLDTIRVDQIPFSDIGAVTGYASKLMFRDLTGIQPSDLFHVWPKSLSERAKNNNSWDSAAPPNVPHQPNSQRHYQPGKPYNNGLDLKREIYANPSAYPGKKLDTIVTLIDHAAQLEAVYSAVLRWCRTKIEEAFRIILHGQEEDIWQFIQACRAQWDKLTLPDIAAPATCTDLATYAMGDPTASYHPQTPIHLQAAIHHNDLLDVKGLTIRYRKIRDGDSMKYLLLSEPNPLQAAAIGFTTVLPKEFGLEGYVDRAAQFELCFRQPLNHALGLIGWRDKKKRSLGVLANRM